MLFDLMIREKGGISMPIRKLSDTEKVWLVLASMKDGVVITDFCAKHKIPRSSFYSWQRNLIDDLALSLKGKSSRSRAS